MPKWTFEEEGATGEHPSVQAVMTLSDVPMVYSNLRSLLGMSDIETEDTAPEDTTPEDTVPEDTTPEDTVPEDTTPEDTVPEDTVPEDTTPEDTVPEDTTPEDTVPEDTTSEDEISDNAGNVNTGDHNRNLSGYYMVLAVLSLVIISTSVFWRIRKKKVTEV